MNLPITYTRAEIANGTGWARNVRFIAVPELLTCLAITAARSDDTRRTVIEGLLLELREMEGK